MHTQGPLALTLSDSHTRQRNRYKPSRTNTPPEWELVQKLQDQVGEGRGWNGREREGEEGRKGGRRRNEGKGKKEATYSKIGLFSRPLLGSPEKGEIKG